MTGTTRIALILTASGVALFAGGPASAQETPGQARARATTQSLNAGPPTSTLQRDITPAGEIISWPDLPPRSSATAVSPAPTEGRTLEALLGAIDGEGQTDEATSEAPAVTLAEGETAPAPIPVALGYYVRGDIDCELVGPGEGDLAFMTPTAFTLDFGGCEPGQFLQTGPNSWRERQSCQTELGGDAGAYVVDYEMVETGVLQRTARLQIDNSVERDRWRFCETADVPQNARFASSRP